MPLLMVLSLLQLIATAALFLAAKSEETPCPLNNTLRASCEILHKQDISFLSYLLSGVSIQPIDSSLLTCIIIWNGKNGYFCHFVPIYFNFFCKKNHH